MRGFVGKAKARDGPGGPGGAGAYRCTRARSGGACRGSTRSEASPSRSAYHPVVGGMPIELGHGRRRSIADLCAHGALVSVQFKVAPTSPPLSSTSAPRQLTMSNKIPLTFMLNDKARLLCLYVGRFDSAYLRRMYIARLAGCRRSEHAHPPLLDGGLKMGGATRGGHKGDDLPAYGCRSTGICG